MKAEPTVFPVAVNVPTVAPAGITTEGGLKVITPAGVAESETVAPVGGAGVLRVMVPLMVWVTPTPEALFAKAIEMDCEPTVMEAAADK